MFWVRCRYMWRMLRVVIVAAVAAAAAVLVGLRWLTSGSTWDPVDNTASYFAALGVVCAGLPALLFVRGKSAKMRSLQAVLYGRHLELDRTMLRTARHLRGVRRQCFRLERIGGSPSSEAIGRLAGELGRITDVKRASIRRLDALAALSPEPSVVASAYVADLDSHVAGLVELSLKAAANPDDGELALQIEAMSAAIDDTRAPVSRR